MKQLALFVEPDKPIGDIYSYDKYIVTFSGGKDSTACFLHLLELGIPREKIELWHQDIDGREETLMDWEVTPAYCIAFARAFNVPIYFSWKEGGFRREMLRENSLTAPTWFEVPEEEYMINPNQVKHEDGRYYVTVGGMRGSLSTRLKFPQVSPNLSVRWCSSYLKIDVNAAAIRNQQRFNNSRTLVLSGERGEESTQRGKYNVWEPDKADGRYGRSKRLVDRHRPVRDWKEEQIWQLIEKYKIRVHPAYYLGFNRVSCKWCIFGNPNQLASANKLSPCQAKRLIQYEQEFGCTIKRDGGLEQYISKGTPYAMNPETMAIALSTSYTLPIFTELWVLPLGAYGESCGPV